MRRGTRVGQAYVAVTADGSGINEEIVDGIDEAGPGADRAGKEHGKRYGEEFGDSLNVEFSHAQKNISDEFNRRMAESGDRDGKDYGDNFEKSMKRIAKKIGNSIGDRLGEGLRDSLEETFARMVDTMESSLSRVSGNGGRGGSGSGTTAGNQGPGARQTLYKDYDFATMFEAARVKLHRDSNDAIQKDDLKLRKSQQALYDSILKMEDQKAAFIAKFEAARVKLRASSDDSILKSDTQLAKDQKILFDRLAKEAEKRDKDLWAVRNTTAKAHYKYLADLAKGAIDDRGNGVKAGTDTDTNLGSRIGGLLGSGSRNNALNLFGKAAGGLVTSLGRLQGVASNLFSTFQKGWAEAGEGATLFQKAAAGGGAAGTEAMASIAASAPAAAAAIIVVVGALSVMASVASALLAIVTALTSTLVSGLTGAVLVLGTGLSAAAAAAGLLVVAFTSMTDAQKTLLTDAFQPLKAELTGIGQLMITQMIPYFDIWASNLQEALLLAAPVAAVMGQAFGEAGAALTSAFSGPGFQMFFRALSVELPGIITTLSAALGSFLNGVTGVFSALLPLVTRFSGYLAQVAERFSTWANSTQGQNAIVDFADRAVASLQSLWDFVREFFGFIFDVLFSPEAQTFGNEMFDGLADSFDRLRKKIDSGDLERWFQDARNFGADLWKVVVALKDTFAALNNSGVLDATASTLELLAWSIRNTNAVLEPFINLMGVDLANAVALVKDPIGEVARQIDVVAGAIENFLGLASKIPGVSLGNGGGGSWGPDHVGTYNPLTNLPGGAGNGLGVLMTNQGNSPSFNIPDLVKAGNTALDATSISAGGNKTKPKFVNPYVDYANSLIKDGPSVSATIRNALNTANKTFQKALRDANGSMTKTVRAENKAAADALRDAATASDADSVKSAMADVVSNMTAQATNAAQSIRSSANSTAATLRTGAKNTVNSAQSALNSAAQGLASASSQAAVDRALKAVKQSQRNLDAAEKAQDKINKKAKRLVDKAKKNAEDLKKRTDAANAILAAQEVTSVGTVQQILNGNPFAIAVATLSDYAAAREFVAGQLEVANQKLADAISLRDTFKTQLSDSIKAFGALTTAQAQVINGIEQDLTSNDIVSNLQDRLGKIKKFQDNLNILLAQGLSDDAYKQILAAGVDGGSAYAEALVQGGQGAVSEVNNLTDQISGVADQLGLDASNRLYQAGVDAAQGLVDGLTSLSAELDAAATALGNRIAAAVAAALGIASPSRVLIGMMDSVGDGAVVGLDNQSNKVGRAAARFSDNIAVSPEVAAYAAAQRNSGGVSGNADQRPIELTVVTPTEDPVAVAHEAINELVGRL